MTRMPTPGASCATSAAALPGSIMTTLMIWPVLIGLALLVALLNAWEFSRHLAIIPAGQPQAAKVHAA